MSRLGRLFGAFRSSKKKEDERRSAERTAIEWVVAGLGNPGKEYARSRHNAGFMVVERIAQAKHAALARRRFGGVTADVDLAGVPAILARPETFYNASGNCVAALLGYFKLGPERLIVVHDDLDLEPGRLRLKQGGGDAGNLGVRSIVESLGTRDFIRVRVGIGHPLEHEDSRDYVLKQMRAAEFEEFRRALERAAEAVEAIASEGLGRAMGRFNQRD
jgi:peptidyl-tRNA hydrolase, PTH1 family